MSNFELRPPVKRWLNEIVGWDASSEIEDVLTEEVIEKAEELAEEVAMDEWTIEGTTKAEIERAIRAHQAKMHQYGGRDLLLKCRRQKKYIEKAAEAPYKPMEYPWREKAKDARDEIRTDIKKMFAHGQRARQLREVKRAITTMNIEEGAADNIDLQEMAPGIKEMMTDPAHDEVSPEMEDALLAVELQNEDDGSERAYEEIDEQIEEVREEGNDADIDISLDEDLEDIEEPSSVSTMSQNEL